ncbi:MAG: hypothetical protein RR310_07295 [Eubacterium sp.]
MAKVIDITSKLTNESPIVKIGDKEYKAETRKNTVIKVYEKMESSNGSPQDICEVIELIIGKEAIAQINKMNPTFGDLRMIFFGVLAAATDDELESVIERFRGKGTNE